MRFVDLKTFVHRVNKRRRVFLGFAIWNFRGNYTLMGFLKLQKRGRKEATPRGRVQGENEARLPIQRNEANCSFGH